MADELPIACSLHAREFVQRQTELRASVLADAVGVERVPNGYRWRFAGTGNLIAQLGGVIDVERRCCRFLRFSLVTDPDMGSVTLEITGPPGTADFLESWIPPTAR